MKINLSSIAPTSVAGAVALALLSSPAQATSIVADGKLDSTYQLGFELPFLNDGGSSIGTGNLFFGINSADSTQFLYFKLPLSYVDNTYGANAAVDWSKGHTFNDLLGSDRWGVTDKKTGAGGFEWGGNSVTFDYIAGVCTADSKDSSKCAKGSSITDYRSGGLGSVLTDGAIDKNDGEVNVDAGGSGGVGSILEIATSLEYNLDQYAAGYLTDSPLMTSNVAGNISYASAVAPNWLYYVGYEVQFAAGTFDAAKWLDPAQAYGLLTLGSVHGSPSKVDYTTYGTPKCIVGCTPEQVPEPGALLLLSSGLGALGWLRRRSRRVSLGRA